MIDPKSQAQTALVLEAHTWSGQYDAVALVAALEAAP